MDQKKIGVFLKCLRNEKGFDTNKSSLVFILLSVVIVVAMMSTCLYTNGLLEKMAKYTKFVKTCKFLLLVLIGIIGWFCVQICFVMVIVLIEKATPLEKRVGIEQYDKSFYLEKYSSEFGSQMLIFPDETDGMIDPVFVSELHTGFFVQLKGKRVMKR